MLICRPLDTKVQEVHDHHHYSHAQTSAFTFKIAGGCGTVHLATSTYYSIRFDRTTTCSVLHTQTNLLVSASCTYHMHY